MPGTGPFASRPYPNLPAYGSANSRVNIGLSYAFDIQANVPIDGRTVVFTDVQRKAINYAYEGLECRVLATGRKYMFTHRNWPNGAVASNDADWLDITESVARNGYQGPWDALNDPFPGLTQPNPVAGDYYIVSEPGSGDINGNGIAQVFSLGDLAIYAPATGWSRIGNYSPTLPSVLTSADITDFDERVAYDIAHGALQLYNPGQSYLKGQMVAVIEEVIPGAGTLLPAGYPTQPIEQQPAYGQQPGTLAGPLATPLYNAQDANNTNRACSIYWALRDTQPGESLGNTTIFLLVATTNYNRLFGRLIMDNLAGAGGANASLDDGTGKVMDIKETMRRMTALLDSNPGGGGGQIYGGAPGTSDAVLGTPVI